MGLKLNNPRSDSLEEVLNFIPLRFLLGDISANYPSSSSSSSLLIVFCQEDFIISSSLYSRTSFGNLRTESKLNENLGSSSQGVLSLLLTLSSSLNNVEPANFTHLLTANARQ